MNHPNKFGSLFKYRWSAATVFVAVFAPLVFVMSATLNAWQDSSSFLDPDTFEVAEGFRAELVYQVGAEYGSWVSLTTTPDGLIASDQYGKLYRIRPANGNSKTEVIQLPLNLGHAQGLLWAFDSLYVMAHAREKEPAGLYRVQDSTGDGKLDQVTLLRQVQGGGEHGPHAVILSPDGQSLYVCAGNHTALPSVQSSRVTRNWQEDNLLERMWDPGGHAVGKMAPGGWVCKTDPEGKDWELISIGFRNQYDIAFDANGELFTYDADMEWDIGTPWYRPTRVCHVIPGSEFGWRGGDAKWPTYFPDNLPPVIDIGPGSPTGIVFGTGAKFPEKYQRALYIADWSFGFIYAIHLTPDGGTWKGEKELFCSAPALQVTDMTVHDGDLYFAIGGRRTQSSLYRVVSVPKFGPKDLTVELGPEQTTRRTIESMESITVDSLDELWSYLSSSDRTVRFAARTKLEQTPLDLWQERAFQESSPVASLEALLALVRQPDSNAKTATRMLKSIEQHLSFDELDEMQQLHLLRVCSLMLSRLANDGNRQTLFDSFNATFSEHYPSTSLLLNRELCRLLVACQCDQAIERTLELIDAAVTQEEQIHYVMCLRTMTKGWDLDSRRKYLNWFVKSAVFQGGKSFSGYLKNARDQFINNMSDAEKTELAELISTEMKNQDPYAELKAREIIKQWTVKDLLTSVDKADLTNRDLENGRRVFSQAQCYKCHQFQGNGGIVGPDLTGLSRRFTNQYLLETLIEPSKEISSQYQATRFELDSGKMITGRVANLVNDQFMIQEDMISPGRLTRIKRDSILGSKPSEVSPMPANLLDSFTEDEIIDLIAYLRSADQLGESPR